jgi:putative peptidoglycan lipid II flippase
MRLMLMLNVPATLGLIVLATPIVQLLFERGHFTPTDTEATAAALRFYAAGLVGYSTARIVSPVFYAIGRSRVPVLVSVATIAVNIVASIALVRTMGFSGLALGTSVAAVTNGAALLWLLRRDLDGIEGAALGVASAKIGVAALAMAAVAAGVEHGMALAVPGAGTAVQAIRLFISIACALAMLAAAAKLLRVREFDDALRQLRGVRDTI